MRITNLSVCGVDCSSLICYGEMCEGCNALAGRPFWAKNYLSSGVCTIYNCVKNIKGYENCAECSDFPCNIFYELRNPNKSEEAHIASINMRVENFNKVK